MSHVNRASAGSQSRLRRVKQYSPKQHHRVRRKCVPPASSSSLMLSISLTKYLQVKTATLLPKSFLSSLHVIEFSHTVQVDLTFSEEHKKHAKPCVHARTDITHGFAPPLATTGLKSGLKIGHYSRHPTKPWKEGAI